MVELTSKITNSTSADLILFEVAYNEIRSFDNNKNQYIESISLLKERPGLQAITYSAIFDFEGN